MKVYTRTGDRGETGLADGSRVRKTHPRVRACGELDELSASLGVARAQGLATDNDTLLREVQRDLLAAGADLARAGAAPENERAGLAADRVSALEQAIDARQAELPELTRFVLPSGSAAGAQLHLSRTVCRRAERALVALADDAPIDPRLVEYLNRLSDLLFVLARQANQQGGGSEELW